MGMDKCYDGETEILTRKGFKFFKDVTYDDEIATRSVDGIMQYQKPTYIHSYEHKGEMYQVKSRNIDLLTTPHHRMLVKLDKEEKYDYKEAWNIIGQKARYLRGGMEWEGKEQEYFEIPSCKKSRRGTVQSDLQISSSLWAKLLGYWYACGYTTSKNVVFYSQSGETLKKIKEDLKDVSDWYLQGKYLQGGKTIIRDYISSNFADKTKVQVFAEINKLPEHNKHQFYDSAVSVLDSFSSRLANKYECLKNNLTQYRTTFNGKVTGDDLLLTLPMSELDSIEPKKIKMDLWLEFLGYYLSEGSSTGIGVQIAQKNGWKKDIMRKCIQQMSQKWNDYEDCFKCSDIQLSTYLKRFGKCQEKHIPEELKNLSKRQIEILFNALMLGDGDAKGKRGYVSSSPKLRDDMMEMGLKLGLSCVYHRLVDCTYPEGKEIKCTHKTHNPCYGIHFSDYNCPVVNNDGKKNDAMIPWNGTVYCVEVPNTSLIVRRGGKVVVSGNTVFRYFFERKMPASMIMVPTEDPEAIRAVRAELAAQMRVNPDIVPMVGYNAKQGRARVDLIRLFHTLQEMDYLPVRIEIRERIAAIWGLPPLWQSEYASSGGGQSNQSQQLVQFSRVVESDQRLFNEKVFPFILDAFNVTDWKLVLKQPEERAEMGRIQAAQQRTAIALQLKQAGFKIEMKEGVDTVDDVDFIISGEMEQQPGGMGMPGMPSQQPEQGQEQPQELNDEREANPFGMPPEGEGQPGENTFQMARDWTSQIMRKGFSIDSVWNVTSLDNGQAQLTFMSKNSECIAVFNVMGNLIDVWKKAEYMNNNPEKNKKAATHEALSGESFNINNSEDQDEDDANTP